MITVLLMSFVYSITSGYAFFDSMIPNAIENPAELVWSTLFRVGAGFHVILGLVLLNVFHRQWDCGWNGTLISNGFSFREIFFQKIIWLASAVLWSLIAVFVTAIIYRYPMNPDSMFWLIFIWHGVIWFSFTIFLFEYNRDSIHITLIYFLWPFLIEPLIFLGLRIVLGVDLEPFRFFKNVDEFGLWASSFYTPVEDYYHSFGVTSSYIVMMWGLIFIRSREKS